MDAVGLGFPGADSSDVVADGGSASAGDIFATLGAISPAASVGSDSGNSSNGSAARDSGGNAFDPDQHIAVGKLNGDGTFRRRRRGRGGAVTGTRREGTKGNASVKSIENSLIGIHALLAASTGFDDLKLSEPDESAPLATAVAEISKHYNIPMLDAKTTAWFGLIVTCGRVYGPKVALIKMELERRKEEKADAKVVPFFKPNLPPTG